MDNCTVEIMPQFTDPSSDARLVIFSNEIVRSEKLDVAKYLVLCSKYAARHRVYLITGLIGHNGNLCLCLLNPEGKVVCRQPALYLSLAQQGQFTPGDAVEVAHTELGNLFLCADMDIYHSQVTRAAALKGADTVISVQSLDPVDDAPQRLLYTIWNAAQSNNLYVINLAAGSCAVACPAPLTRGGDGWLVRRAPAPPARFALNMIRLDEVRRGFDLVENINTELIRRYAGELGRAL